MYLKTIGERKKENLARGLEAGGLETFLKHFVKRSAKTSPAYVTFSHLDIGSRALKREHTRVREETSSSGSLVFSNLCTSIVENWAQKESFIDESCSRGIALLDMRQTANTRVFYTYELE